MRDGHRRSLGKTISYRVSSSILTVLVVFIITGKYSISLAIGGIDAIVKIVWYYLHERLWNHTNWGKSK